MIALLAVTAQQAIDIEDYSASDGQKTGIFTGIGDWLGRHFLNNPDADVELPPDAWEQAYNAKVAAKQQKQRWDDQEEERTRRRVDPNPRRTKNRCGCDDTCGQYRLDTDFVEFPPPDLGGFVAARRRRDGARKIARARGNFVPDGTDGFKNWQSNAANPAFRDKCKDSTDGVHYQFQYVSNFAAGPDDPFGISMPQSASFDMWQAELGRLAALRGGTIKGTYNRYKWSLSFICCVCIDGRFEQCPRGLYCHKEWKAPHDTRKGDAPREYWPFEDLDT